MPIAAASAARRRLDRRPARRDRSRARASTPTPRPGPERRHDLSVRGRPDGLLVSLIQSNFTARRLRAARRRVGDQPAQPRLGVPLRRRRTRTRSAAEAAAAHVDPRARAPRRPARGSCSGAKGGHGQAQTHLQLLTRMLSTATIRRPRSPRRASRSIPDRWRVTIEDHFDPEWIDDLRGARPRRSTSSRRIDTGRAIAHAIECVDARVPRRLRSAGRRRRRRALSLLRSYRWDAGGSEPSRIMDRSRTLISVVRLACVPVFLWLLWGDRRADRRGRCCSRCSAPPTGSTATSPATSTRAASSARSSIPTADRVLLVAAAVALLVEDLPVAVDIVVWIVLVREVLDRGGHDRARGRPARAASTWSGPARRERSRSCSRCRCSSAPTHDSDVVARVLHRVRVGASRSAASSSGTTPPRKYIPAARGRAARRTASARELQRRCSA